MARRIALEDVGSTNTVALERIEEGERPPFWVTATRQIAGRGRMGRAWDSPPGNLYATHAFVDEGPPERRALLSLVAATAVRAAIVEASGARPVTLKWPNDVLLDGAKVAGILLEAHAAEGRRLVLIGCGINCATHPRQVDYPATNLSAAGYPVEPDCLFAALDRRMATALAAWNLGERSRPIIDEWLAHAHGLGERTTVRTPTGRLAGTLRGLDETGRLLLDTDDGRVAIAAGDLEPPRAE